MRETKSMMFILFARALFVSGFWLTSCSPKQDEEALKAKAREIHGLPDRLLKISFRLWITGIVWALSFLSSSIYTIRKKH